MRLHATELLMLLGTVIVMVLEPPAEKAAPATATAKPAAAPALSLREPQLLDHA
jgi:hypothetical protein